MSREIDQCNAFLNLCASLFRSHFLVSTYRRVQFVLFANNSSVVALQEFLFCFVFPQFAAVLARSLFNRSFFVCFSCCLLLPEKRKEGFSCVCLCVFVEVMAGCGGVLLVTDVAMLPASVVLWAVQTFGDKAAGGKAMAVVTNASHLAPDRHLGLATASLEVVISLVENPGHHTKAWLSEIVHVLRPGGVLWLQEPFACQDVAEADQQRLGDAPVQTQAVLERNLLLAGFVDIETAECVSGVGLAESYSTSATGSEHGPLLKPVAVRVLKPTWETGSSFGIKKKATLEQESTLVSLGDTLRLSSEDVNDTSLPLANTWKATSVDDDGDEFVDEDALLDEDDLKRPVLPGVDDCEVEKAGKKACKNCTCGRAELEEKTPLTAAQLNNPQSACGNCGLGDAFRCGGCPYRGLPAFKLGEKISLPGSLLVADA